MQNFQDTFETRQRSFTSAFSICMTVPLTSIRADFSQECSQGKKERDLILEVC